METRRVAILSAALTAAFFLGLAALAAGPLRSRPAPPVPSPLVMTVTPAPVSESEALRRRLEESNQALKSAYVQIERLQAAQGPPPGAGRGRHHELRSPLASIKLRAEALLGGGRDDPAVAERYLVEIDREVDRLSSIAGRLLLLTRQQAAPPAAGARCDAGAVAEEVVARETPRARDLGIALDARVAPDLPAVAASSEDVDTILSNLVDNALKDTAGTVVVETARESAGVLLTVRDDGPGVSPDHLPRLFEPFYRPDESRHRGATTGVGLGLAIVDATARRNGGHTSAHSLTPGFEVSARLPARKTDA